MGKLNKEFSHLPDGIDPGEYTFAGEQNDIVVV